MDSKAPQKPIADGITIIPNSSKDFLRTWLEVMRPLHNLTPREMDFTAILLQKRREIAESCSDPKVIDAYLFGEEAMEDIRQRAGLKESYMGTLLHRVRESGVVIDKTVNPSYIPSWTPGKPFRAVFIFKNEV